ncbi:unnamed protein product [Staurois parvus]|uniref:Uncharacterized protein n=1 Tax=Staurois parvus TaxID=386267 RepID=A0ABN9GLK5_9NEOB|nr:unnamed protein product [Staurois parvus]
MYINGRRGAGQEWVAVYKCPPCFPACVHSLCSQCRTPIAVRDLCISHVVSNDVRSDILLTTLHVITDCPISDHMIGTSHRGPVRRHLELMCEL